MNTDFACLSTEHIALHANKVTDIEQAFEHLIIHILVLTRAEVIAGDIHLNAPLGVLQLSKTCLAHHSSAHQSACYAHLSGLCLIAEGFLYLCAEGVGRILCCRIGIDAHLAQLLQALSSAYFLFTQF